MPKAPNLGVTMLQIKTDAGIAKLCNIAMACREQAERHGATADGRIYRAIAQGLDMVMVASPGEIANNTIQLAIKSAAGSSQLTRDEQARAMKVICEQTHAVMNMKDERSTRIRRVPSSYRTARQLV